MKLFVVWRIILCDDYYSRTIESHREIDSIWISEEKAKEIYNLHIKNREEQVKKSGPYHSHYFDKYELEEVWTNDE